jgi:Bacterial Ig-like domain (group 3)/Calx-beta domain/Right handed beta helix region
MFFRRHPCALLLLISALTILGRAGSAMAATPPTLPLSYVDTTMPTPTGLVIAVPAGGNLQGALDTAQPGDVVELAAGATFSGHYILRNKNTASTSWIMVRSAAYGALPPEGTRVSPSDAANMATISSPDYAAAITTETGAHHYRFVGIEITGATPPPNTANSALVTLDGSYYAGYTYMPQNTLSMVPHHFVFDRCYVHAGPDVAGVSEFVRGFVLNSAWTAVIDSHVSGFRGLHNGDTQALIGWNGPGPFKIVNNYLEAAGENVMFGGATANVPSLVPSDIEVRGNTIKKQLSWRPGDPSYAGTAWLTKNLMEIKNGQRVLVEGNVFQNHWSGGQSGWFFMLTPRVEYGQNPWATVSDITFRNNHVQRVTAGVATSGADNWPAYKTYAAGTAPGLSHRVAITNNLFEDVGIYQTPGDFAGVFLMMNNGTTDVTIAHNTVFNTKTMVSFGGYALGVETALTFRDNIIHVGGYGMADDGTMGGTPAYLLTNYAPGYVFAGNALVGPWPNENGVPNSVPSWWPVGNFFPQDKSAVGFVDLVGASSDYHGYALSSGSPYHNAATDGTDVGVDIVALAAALAGGDTSPNSQDPPGSPGSGPTTTTVSASSVTYGQSATVTVTVSSTGGTPTGSVSLAVDGGTAVSAALSNGQAGFTITGLSAGGHSLFASYAGQGSYSASSVSGSLQVTPAATTTAINAPAVTYPSNAVVTVTVSSSAGTPSGTVSLIVDGGAALSAPLSSGTAQFTLTSPNAGTHALSATYAAQQNFGGSSVTGTVQVNGSGTGSVVDPLYFSSVAYSAKEGSKATVTVLRSGPTGGKVSVQYATSNGTAVAGVDYVAKSGTLAFGPGVTKQSFTVQLMNNFVVNSNRTVNLTLSNPGGGAVLGTPAAAVLTIVNTK